VGLELADDKELALGGDVRLSFSLSPLTVSLAFDYYFFQDRTLFQISANPLYYLPISTPRLSPYVGAGVGVTRFELHDAMPGVDDNGVRIGLNLIAGVRFDLPVLSPFVQAMVTVGDIDLFTIGGGFLFGSGKVDRGRGRATALTDKRSSHAMSTVPSSHHADRRRRCCAHAHARAGAGGGHAVPRHQRRG
jgi:hypothetical protein